MARAGRPQEEDGEVRGADEEPDHVSRLTEAKKPSPRGVFQHPRRGEKDEGERPGRRAHEPPVTRRKISSSDASPPAFARISSSVPRSTAFPRERTRTREQISSTSGRRCDDTMTEAPAAARRTIVCFI